MSDSNSSYIWRCAKCSAHFANISRVGGLIKIEKKCPKCKALNILTLSKKEIILQCKFPEEENGPYEDGGNELNYNNNY